MVLQLSYLGVLAAFIYRRTYKPETLASFQSEMLANEEADDDWIGRFTRLLGLDSPVAADALRLYVLLHADHEGGNVSAHLAHCVNSAHSDIFYAFAAALCGLAGPLHGLASQDALLWQMKLLDWLSEEKQLTLDKTSADNAEKVKEAIREYAGKEFDAGRVIPGFGHAVLRDIDPR